MQIMIYSRNQSYQRQITRHIIASGVPSMGKLEIDLKKKRGGSGNRLPEREKMELTPTYFYVCYPDIKGRGVFWSTFQHFFPLL